MLRLAFTLLLLPVAPQSTRAVALALASLQVNDGPPSIAELALKDAMSRDRAQDTHG